MPRGSKILPVRSWAYPLYDLALIGWLFGAPISGYYALHDRVHVTAIILGPLALISLAAALVGRRDGIGIPEYFDSTLSR